MEVAEEKIRNQKDRSKLQYYSYHFPRIEKLFAPTRSLWLHI